MELTIIASLSNGDSIVNDEDVLYMDWKRAFRRRDIEGCPILMDKSMYDFFIKRFGGNFNYKKNIVVFYNEKSKKNSNLSYRVHKSSSVKGSIDIARRIGGKEGSVYIAGRAKLFKETIDLADRLDITKARRYISDTVGRFPNIDENEWRKAFEKPFSDYYFIRYERAVN